MFVDFPRLLFHLQLLNENNFSYENVYLMDNINPKLIELNAIFLNHVTVSKVQNNTKQPF
jgi:hypothetical protein